MELHLSQSKRHSLFYFTLIISITCLIVAVYMAKQENSESLYEAMQHEKLDQLMDQNKTAELKQIILDLLSKDSNKKSYILLWEYGICLAQEGNYGQAKEYFLKAQELRSFVVKNQLFSYQMGQIYYLLGDYQNSEKYLLASYYLNTVPELTKKTDVLLKAVREKIGKNE